MIDSFTNGEFYDPGIDYGAVMRKHIHKHNNYMQPIFEAVSNAFEAIDKPKGEITISLNFNKQLFNNILGLSSISIHDNGVGFNEENTNRFKRLFDESKGFNNFGTGRLQFLHFFHTTEIHSIFEENGKKYERAIVLKKSFLKQYHTVMWIGKAKDANEELPIGTTISLYTPIDENDKSEYNNLTTELLREKLYVRYLERLCIKKPNNPTIYIQKYVSEVHCEDEDKTITNEDVPNAEARLPQDVHYSYIDPDGNIQSSSKVEKFFIHIYKLSHVQLQKNAVKLLSKNEAVDVQEMSFPLIVNSDRIDDDYRLFLISSEYLTNKDSDVRGKLSLYSRESLLKSRNVFNIDNPEILIEDIQSNVTASIAKHYPQIAKTKKNYDAELDKLIQMFGLDRETVRNVSKTYDSSLTVLRSAYAYDAEQKAKRHNQLKEVIDSLRNIDPSKPKYREQLRDKVNKLTTLIPLANKNELTSYINHRRVILQLFDNILNKRQECQNAEGTNKKSKKDNSETLFHKLLFPKDSETIDSNIWMINDDFIHYEGLSETKLKDVTYKGETIIRDDLTKAEIAELNSFNRNKLGNRPDILLFPEEGKCIIVELKSISVNVAKYLEQVKRYASLIREYSKKKYDIRTFYAYIIGEEFTKDDVMRADGNFKEDLLYNSYYVNTEVYGGKDKSNLIMTIEIIRYSKLIERALSRNKRFIDLIDK